MTAGIKEYLTSNFLFQIDRVALHRVDKGFALAGIVSIILAVSFRLWAMFSANPVTKKLVLRLFNLFLFVGLSELIWFGARSQLVNFFGSHFVAVLVLLVGLVWFIFIVIYFFGKYKKELVAWQKEQVKLKYLNR